MINLPFIGPWLQWLIVGPPSLRLEEGLATQGFSHGPTPRFWG